MKNTDNRIWYKTSTLIYFKSSGILKSDISVDCDHDYLMLKILHQLLWK